MSPKTQDIEALIEAPLIRLSGGISVNQSAYAISGKESRKQPYTYIINSNLNTSIKGVVDVPISFAYSNKETDYQYALPFNRFALSPSYKWIKSHIGFTTMSFSPYSVSGHEFLGFGVELNPTDKFNFSFLYGRFKEAIEADSLESNTPVFKRMGWGFKTGYKFEKFSIGLILFKAYDDEKSISQTAMEDTARISPQDNFVGSINLKLGFIKNLNLDIEYTLSAINQNSQSEKQSAKIPNFLFNATSSTSYYDQIKLGLNYQVGKYGSIGVAYERVDPNYKTLGAYYFTNDFENINLNLSTSLLSWLSLSGSLGIQKDNLEDQKSAGMNRTVFSINASIKASKKLNFNTSYSNFQSYSYIKPVLDKIQELEGYENVDTLNFTQINQSLNVGANYILPSSKTKRQSLNLNTMLQQTATEKGGSQNGDKPLFINLTGGYSLNMKQQNFGFNLAGNYNDNQSGENHIQVVGVSMNIKKSFFDKKLKSSINTNFNNTYNNGNSMGLVVNSRLSNSYSLLKKHNFGFNLSMLNNNSGEKAYHEFTATLSYSYNFNSEYDTEKGFKGEF
jgi:hypothetical protein